MNQVAAHHPTFVTARKGDYTVGLHPHREVRAFIVERHYAKGAANTSVYSFGLFKQGKLVGGALWMPPLPTVERWARKFVEQDLLAQAARIEPKQKSAVDKKRRLELEAKDVLERAGVLTLSRLVVDDAEPQYSESIFIGAMLRQIAKDRRYRIVVTYADEGVAGHHGTIYRATNWTHAPVVGKSHSRWYDESGSLVSRKSKVDRTDAEMFALGFRKESGGTIHRFIKLLW